MGVGSALGVGVAVTTRIISRVSTRTVSLVTSTTNGSALSSDFGPRAQADKTMRLINNDKVKEK